MRALVTGAAGSIGTAIVEQLTGEGWDVVAHDRDISCLAEHAAAGVEVVASDLLVDTVPIEGPLDAVIAAHGVEGARPLPVASVDWARRVMGINAASVDRLLSATMPALERSERSTFVVVASQAGLIGEANNAVYCASKFALVAWADALRNEMATAHRIAVRVLCPGCTESRLLFEGLRGIAAAEGIEADLFIEQRQSQIPAGRFAAAAETAAAAVYLARPALARPPLLAATGGEVLW